MLFELMLWSRCYFDLFVYIMNKGIWITIECLNICLHCECFDMIDSQALKVLRLASLILKMHNRKQKSLQMHHFIIRKEIHQYVVSAVVILNRDISNYLYLNTDSTSDDYSTTCKHYMLIKIFTNIYHIYLTICRLNFFDI